MIRKPLIFGELMMILYKPIARLFLLKLPRAVCHLLLEGFDPLMKMGYAKH